MSVAKNNHHLFNSQFHALAVEGGLCWSVLQVSTGLVCESAVSLGSTLLMLARLSHVSGDNPFLFHFVFHLLGQARACSHEEVPRMRRNKQASRGLSLELKPYHFHCILLANASHRDNYDSSGGETTLNLRVRESCCITQPTSQGVDTGRSKRSGTFLQSMIVVLKLPSFCLHTAVQNLFSWACLTEWEMRKEGRTVVLGSISTVYAPRACRVDLLFSVSVLSSSWALILVFISTYQMWMNVPIPELARRTQLAITVLEAILVSATQDLNPALET